jgi:uncharacterized damage-inducible protein DinB
MEEVAKVVDVLDRGFGGDAWHGPSLRELLADVTPRQAAARPIAGAHSIWEIVLHLTAWKREVAARMRGRPAGEPAEGDWPLAPRRADATPEAWAAAVDALARAHDDLVSAARAVSSERLHAPVADPRSPELGTGVTHYVTLHGVAQHDAYHGGQIALLKKLPVA